MGGKSADAFRTISEVAELIGTPAHVLRFWESKFSQIRPVKRAGGRRYYRPADVALIDGIRRLLHDDGMTIRGVQKILREKGQRHVAALSRFAEGLEGVPEPMQAPGLEGTDEPPPEQGGAVPGTLAAIPEPAPYTAVDALEPAVAAAPPEMPDRAAEEAAQEPAPPADEPPLPEVPSPEPVAEAARETEQAAPATPYPGADAPEPAVEEAPREMPDRAVEEAALLPAPPADEPPLPEVMPTPVLSPVAEDRAAPEPLAEAAPEPAATAERAVPSDQPDTLGGGSGPEDAPQAAGLDTAALPRTSAPAPAGPAPASPPERAAEPLAPELPFDDLPRTERPRAATARPAPRARDLPVSALLRRLDPSAAPVAELAAFEARLVALGTRLAAPADPRGH